MNTLDIILSVLVCLTAIASAVPDHVVTGPYNISFDLGLPHDAYKITIEDPEQQKTASGTPNTKYTVTIDDETGGDGFIVLLLSESSVKAEVSGEDRAKFMAMVLSGDGYTNVDSAAMIIDGKDGAICSGGTVSSGIKIKAYEAYYYPVEGTLFTIRSTYPWEEGMQSPHTWEERTQNLLETIHVAHLN